MRSGSARIASIFAAILIGLGIVAVAPSSPANASSQTCIIVKGGTMCTKVYGRSNFVNAVTSSRMGIGQDAGALTICDYSAWFFAVHPDGHVESLGTEFRGGGCGVGRVYLGKEFHREFPHRTLMCTKFYEDNWQTFVGEKCVGLS